MLLHSVKLWQKHYPSWNLTQCLLTSFCLQILKGVTGLSPRIFSLWNAQLHHTEECKGSSGYQTRKWTPKCGHLAPLGYDTKRFLCLLVMSHLRDIKWEHLMDYKCWVEPVSAEVCVPPMKVFPNGFPQCSCITAVSRDKAWKLLY